MRPEWKAKYDKFMVDHDHILNPKKSPDGDVDPAGVKESTEPKSDDVGPLTKQSNYDRLNAEREKNGLAPLPQKGQPKPHSGDGSHHSHFQPRHKDLGHFKGPPKKGWDNGAAS